MQFMSIGKNLREKKPKNSFAILIAVALLISTLFLLFNNNDPLAKESDLGTFLTQAENGEVQKIEVTGNEIYFELFDGSKFTAYKETNDTISNLLKDVPKSFAQRISIEIKDQSFRNVLFGVLQSWLPAFLLIGFLIFMMRQAQSSNNQALSFGKSSARLNDKASGKTLFTDVAGSKEAKEELVEVVDFLKNPEKYAKIGAKIPKGVLLVGSPGTGKTLLARAVAGEADVPFFNISGSEFVEMFVGVGASRVRDLFNKAKKNSPCIIFIDEIDAVGRQRGAGLGGGHDEREQTLNQILTEMDGFETGTSVIVIAATNRPDVLDPALLRPGRFDRRVTVDLPDLKDREEILAVHSRNKPLAKDVEIEKIARHTPGFSGADLENLLNGAAILAARKSKKQITQEFLEQSIEKVLMGPERSSRVLSDQEKKITAYHEVGHAVVGHLLPNCDPVHKVSIVSRGHALGVTWFLPEEDRHLYSRSKFEDQLCSLLGGYVAEETFFGETTTGPSNDLERVSNIARKMVMEYGMTPMGPVIFGDKNHEVFLGRDFGHTKNYSEEVAAQLDKHIREFIDAAYARTKKLVADNKDLIIKISEALIEKETLNRDEFLAFFPEKESKAKKS
jgi:cell division protease FtsH